MLDYNEFLSIKNKKCADNYSLNLKKIKKIRDENRESEDEFLSLAYTIAARIILMSDLEKEYSENYYKDHSLMELQKSNQNFFSEILPGNYERSYADPEFTTKIFGKELGVVFSSFYLEFRSFLSKAIEHRIFEMERWNSQFLEFYGLLKKKEKERRLCAGDN